MSNNISHADFAIYEDGKLTEIIQPDHIGLIGIHSKDTKCNYNKGSTLEVGLINPNKMCCDECRVPVIVSLSDNNGVALRLKDYNSDKVKRWSIILAEVYGS